MKLPFLSTIKQGQANLYKLLESSFTNTSIFQCNLWCAADVSNKAIEYIPNFSVSQMSVREVRLKEDNIEHKGTNALICDVQVKPNRQAATVHSSASAPISQRLGVIGTNCSPCQQCRHGERSTKNANNRGG